MARSGSKALNRTLMIVVALGLIAAAAWYLMPGDDELSGPIASGNGRIEATEVDIATRIPGRLESFGVREGDMVESGALLAVMDTDELQASLASAQANLHQAEQGRRLAEAVVAQRESERRYARAELARIESLADRGHASQEQLDRARTAAETAEAALQAARVQVASADAGIEAAHASIRRIQTNIDDSKLTTPVGGRVLYRLAEPGEVLAAGGKVATVLDVTDVYMTIFLPTAQAGKVRVGAEARIILDALPDYVVPAEVSFVAAEAQFTPKSVETRSEREKLMFRVRIRIDADLLKAYRDRVKTGVPGEAFVRTDESQPWPENLNVALPNG
ncbi:HlyD family efflux transporter periplasmic adaptor subunit [Marinobacter daepoensis]|uniref:HlyD family efflux transporter periplasmic adaptor subunit n=1 Tax=Marinobacter daepoensis TaxID=262077 RepID=A0ABS3BE51_9GAMM|nr:HlyD family efflux transporter periplasmic adaptor subunit [Marinobacter daepoensis]MBN7769934.1 HlyD family efflux transporter periplasmic adaptor subunit [Marinobacter daepoensis]MBY6080322.1 HlyD family efflux transporter periplasmic adaptor subunit [Marinobacter daepoensis]